MKTFLWIIVIALFCVGALAGTKRLFFREETPGSERDGGVISEDGKVRSEDVAPVPMPEVSEKNPQWRVEEVVGGLDTPWSIVFTSSERMLLTERAGRLREVRDGILKPEPLYVFGEVQEKGEEGLMSLTLSPDYPSDRFVYVSLAYPAEGGLFVKVMRFQDDGTGLRDPVDIIDAIPAAQFHAGCRIAFGPDGKLYVTTGDATDTSLPQDKDSLAGKILRLNPDGSIPADNPFPDSPVWSYGHRNPQGITWQDDTGAMYATEHGPSGFDGPGGGDELNHIIQGGNYGWPLVSHTSRLEGTIAPLLVFTPAEAPAALLSYSGRVFPEWRGNLFFGALKGEGLFHVVLDAENPDKAVRYEKLDIGSLGRIREVMEGPDGFIYFSTSNRDGRGTPATRDDRIMRIRPVQ
ncbi:MAG: PQQ-dependent sugar dehydrogenase [Candidatus Moranbacteria bacterium]|nr:PQQ-dependent sugar dehydrogenase [Candidatus Moranbacteria bacterium]